MDVSFLTNRKFKRVLLNILSMVVILAMAFPVTEGVAAEGEEPGLRAFPDQDRVDGSFWPAGQLVYLRINADELGSVTADGNGYVEFLLGGYDLKRGDTLTMWSGDISVTYTARQLFVDQFDLEAQTVSGTIDGQMTVHVWTGDAQLYVESIGDNWLADFSEFNGVLFPGACGNAEAWGEGPGSTIVDWCIPNPRFTVFPEWEWFDGYDWPAGATVNITVEGKPECAMTKESPGSFFNGGFPEGCDVAIGDSVSMSDGTTSRTHQVQNLDVTQVEIRDDTVYGTADTGAVVHVWPHDDGAAEMVLHVEDGTWMAEFWRNSFDLVEGMCGRAEIRDEAGNATAVDWCYPIPHFTVFPEWDYIEGSDWHPNDYVYLTIEPGSSEDSVSFYTQARTELPSWDPNRWWVFFDLKDQFDLKAGDTVQLDDDSVTRTMTVRNLSVTNVDPVANVIGGMATPGAEIQVWPHETGQQLQAVANSAGAWQVDFTDVFDLVPGTCGRSQIVDEFDNATAVDWCAPKPLLTAFPENDAVEGWEWPEGATVTLTIDNAPELAWSETAAVTTWGDPRTYVRIEFGNDYDLQIGDEVTLTDEFGTMRTHTVQNLAVTKVSPEDDVIKGIADMGAEVHVWPHSTGQEQVAITNPNSKWAVDFTGVYDLMPGEGGRAEIRDEMGNATAVDWYIPNPHIIASITEDWFYLAEFAPGKKLHFSIYNSQGGSLIWHGTRIADVNGFAWIDSEGWNLEPGNYLIVSSGDTTKELTVEDFTFDQLDLITGHLQGTVPGAAEGRRVWVGIGFENETWSTDTFTDPDGNWAAEYGSEITNPYDWVAAQIFDEDGDGSELRPSAVINWTVRIANQPDWVNSGIAVSAGQSFTIEAFGLMNPCSDTYPNGGEICIFYTPAGGEWDVPYENEFGIFPGPGLPFMALLGRVGDGKPFYIGEGGTFTAQQDGTLWFTPNDNLRTDNQGAYGVLVGLEP